ncbi:hypothetical protein [Kitasatospora sp. NPDC057198]|uniref:hypothetical protein n=1 Tax=Kitasatospora sp. NPDC057198 TaxID=3346046 RepID=UPI003636CFAB
MAATGTDTPTPGTRHPHRGRHGGRYWYTAAALASATVPAVFLRAVRLADEQITNPVVVPGDDSPGGGSMGYAAVLPLYALAALVCLLLPLRWARTALRARSGRSAWPRPAVTALLQGATLVFALPLALTLPQGPAWATALVTAQLLAVVAAVAAAQTARRP